MKFRDFVEGTRDALESLAFGIEGERDITPMLHLESEGRHHLIGIDPRFFESSATVELLAERYVIPAIAENRARKVAWTHSAWAAPEGGPRPSEHAERLELLLATFIDPEVVEFWAAPIVRTGGPVLLGPWRSALPNSGGGPLITRIQQALR